jgi:hypothetical protein
METAHTFNVVTWGSKTSISAIKWAYELTFAKCIEESVIGKERTHLMNLRCEVGPTFKDPKLS